MLKQKNNSWKGVQGLRATEIFEYSKIWSQVYPHRLNDDEPWNAPIILEFAEKFNIDKIYVFLLQASAPQPAFQTFDLRPAYSKQSRPNTETTSKNPRYPCLSLNRNAVWIKSHGWLRVSVECMYSVVVTIFPFRFVWFHRMHSTWMSSKRTLMFFLKFAESFGLFCAFLLKLNFMWFFTIRMFIFCFFSKIASDQCAFIVLAYLNFWLEHTAYVYLPFEEKSGPFWIHNILLANPRPTMYQIQFPLVEQIWKWTHSVKLSF